MNHYKLSKAARLLRCDVFDLLEAGVDKKLRLHVWCGVPVERVVVIEEGSFHEHGSTKIPVYIKDEYENDDYPHLIKNRFYEIPSDLLWNLHMAGNSRFSEPWSFIHIEDEEEDQLYVELTLPIDVSIDSICILEKDFKIAQKLNLSIAAKKETIKTSPYAFKDPTVTNWKQVVIRIVDLETVEIVHGKKTYTKHYKEIGFVKINMGFTRDWLTLQLMAKKQGDLKHPNQVDDKDTTAGKQQVHTLKVALKKLFPEIEGEPWEDYKPGVGWTLNIRLISNVEESSNPYYPPNPNDD